MALLPCTWADWSLLSPFMQAFPAARTHMHTADASLGAFCLLLVLHGMSSTLSSTLSKFCPSFRMKFMVCFWWSSLHLSWPTVNVPFSSLPCFSKIPTLSLFQNPSGWEWGLHHTQPSLGQCQKQRMCSLVVGGKSEEWSRKHCELVGFRLCWLILQDSSKDIK